MKWKLNESLNEHKKHLNGFTEHFLQCYAIKCTAQKNQDDGAEAE